MSHVAPTAIAPEGESTGQHNQGVIRDGKAFIKFDRDMYVRYDEFSRDLRRFQREYNDWGVITEQALPILFSAQYLADRIRGEVDRLVVSLANGMETVKNDE